MTSKSPYRSFPTPQQHGAWAMFLLPAVITVVVLEAWYWSSLFLIISFILIFLAHRPALRLLRRMKNHQILDRQSLLWVILFAGSGISLACFLFISHRQWSVFIFGGLVAMTMFLHLRLTINREHMTIPGEIVGVVGLTASAPVLYLFQFHSLDTRGWLLWMMSFLYFTGSIFYIKLKVRYQTGRKEPDIMGKLWIGLPAIMFICTVLILIGVLVFSRGYSWLFLLAYLPSLVKIITGVFHWQSRDSLKITRYGFNEILYAIFFAFLMIWGFKNTLSED
ncbi:MAG: YwiC-like family protein [Fidelibacterota bacterium]